MAAGNIYNYFAINMSTGDVTLNIKNVGELKTIKKGCHVLEILVSDMGKPKVLSTTAWVNIYITDEKPRNMNATNALKACMNNTFYPILHMKDLNMGKAGADELAFILIICFATLLLLVIVIMIVMLVKYKCCCTKRKMSRSYNCQKANNLYPDEIYQPSLSIEKQPGSQTSLSHTAWSAEQMVEENKNLNGHDELSEGGSVVSHYTGKDSGTGDSMPSDAHNPPYYRVMYNARNELYPPHQLPMPSQSTVNQADKPIYSVGNQSLRSRSSNSFTSRCTNECHVRGHGDNCWMPDTMHHHQDYMDHVPRPTIQYVEHPNYHTAIPCPIHGENCNSLACLQNNYGQDSNYGNQYQAMNPELNLPHHMPLNMEYDAYPNHTYGVEQRNIEKAYVNLQQRSSIAMAVDNEHSYPPYQYDYMDNGDTGLLSPLDYNDDEYMLDQPSHVAIPPQLNQRTEEGFKSNDGLSTIKEELDAEEVVAEIDHLLQ
uniref:Cadherin domain-containing protein n=1 Tax=Ciona savignyi TaxID=51511 RepID=H2YM08_CIOSA